MRFGTVLGTAAFLLAASAAGASVEEHIARGKKLFLQKKTTDAVLEFLKAAGEEPDRPEPYLELGILNQVDGRYAQAIHWYRVALGADPQNRSALLSLAQSYERLGLLQDAIEVERRRSELDPGDASVLKDLADALYQAGRLDEALPVYEQAARINGCDDQIQNRWGVILMFKGFCEEALPHFQEAVRLNPSFTIGKFCSDEVIPQGEQWEKVEEFGTEDLFVVLDQGGDEGHRQIFSRYDAPQYNIALCLVRLGDPDGTLDWLDRAVGIGYPRTWMSSDPALIPLRDDPRFARFLAGRTAFH